jgi:hypothetical protein
LEKDTRSGKVLRDNQGLRDKALVPLDSMKMHLAMIIGDYTDFFVGLQHAVTVSDDLIWPLVDRLISDRNSGDSVQVW